MNESSPFSGLSPAARAVLVELLLRGPLSRAETARRLGLSPSVLTKLTRPLLDAGFLTELPQPSGRPTGRPSRPMRVESSRRSYVGVKLTADRLFAVRTDLGARVLDDFDLELDRHDVPHIVELLGKAVTRLSGTEPPAAVGVSVAGTATRGDPVVHRSPFLGWRDVPLADLLRDTTGLPVVVENDVRALTAAEHWFGAAAGLRTFALVTVGAGLGCGMVIDDRLVSGHGGVSGLVGHLAIDDRGPLCEQGHRGCARAYASTSAILRSVRGALERPNLGFDDCVALARDGDPVARRVFTDAGRALGRIVATVTNLIGPEAVVLSGESVHMYDVCADALADAQAEHTHWTTAPAEVLVRPFGFVEWARGAAVIALRHDLHVP